MSILVFGCDRAAFYIAQTAVFASIQDIYAHFDLKRLLSPVYRAY